MEQNEQNKELLHKLNTIMHDIHELEAINTDHAYYRTKQKIARNNRNKWIHKLSRIAAILSIPLHSSTLILGYIHFKKSEIPTRYAEVTAANGSIIKYELPDGSIVWLNSGSKLSYPITFTDDNRQVTLSGEAYFDVTANPEKPFYVKTTEGITTYVYGTHFNVNAYQDNPYIETILEEGKVNILMPHNKSSEIKLLPGEGFFYDKDSKSYKKRNVDTYEYTAWKEGKLIFRNTKLEDIVKRLSRHFNVDITLNNHSKKTYRYRATFSKESLTQILDYLSRSAKLKWEENVSEQQPDGSLSRSKIIIDLY